jgi:hypothetical protein
MRLYEFESQPAAGDQLDIELGDVVVETVIISIKDGNIYCETNNAAGYGHLRESVLSYQKRDFTDLERAVMEGGHSIADLDEAEYQGREVKLGKPTRGDVKKFKVYVKNPKGNVVKVNFGDPNMRIKKYIPARRRSFRARHNCDNPGPRHKARYWSCRAW